MINRHTAVSALVFGAILLPLQSCGKGSAAQVDARTEPPLVRTATVQVAVQPVRRFTGVVSARVQSNLGFRVSGKIVERLVDTGQKVSKGQALMRVDNNDYALAIAAQTAAVQAAKAEVVQADADENRFRNLVATGATSATIYARAKAAADVSHAQLDAAQAQVTVTENTSSYSVLTADVDGVVVETLAEPGQVVAAGQTVVRLAASGPREATISLPETFLPAIGSKATAVVFNGKVSGEATLRQLSNSADLQTRTFEARYVLGGRASDAPLGSTIDIAIPDNGVANALQVPLAAVFDIGAGPGIWIIDDKSSSVSFKRVEVAAIGVETATVSNGIKPGERFVSLGAHLLHEGEVVRTAKPAGDVK